MEKITRSFKLGEVEVTLTKVQLEHMLKEFNKPEFEYPMYFKCKVNKLIVKFTGLSEGVQLNGDEIGERDDNWINHTNKGVWEQIPYDKERDLYHGQIVYCWDEDETHRINVKFYDAVNVCTFSFDGSPNGATYDNYSTTMPEFMLTAAETLEGIS